jgi:hypothetical protein
MNRSTCERPAPGVFMNSFSHTHLPDEPSGSSRFACHAVETKLARGGWREVAPRDHFVQIYAEDEQLVASLAAYTADTFEQGERIVMIATPAHRAAVDRVLRERGVDIATALVRRRYLACDAEETLALFTRGEHVDPERFEQVIGGLIRLVSSDGRPVRAFGEMVALLWDRGHPTAALQLEELWNGLAARHPFSLYCAYPVTCFGSGARLLDVCRCHTRIVPVESRAA